MLPLALLEQVRSYDVAVIDAEIEALQSEIDEAVFAQYGFDECDREAIFSPGNLPSRTNLNAGGSEAGVAGDEIKRWLKLGSWCLGVTFGRFDLRLVTGEREAPPLLEPFDPLPSKSPGMLPDGAAPYHHHQGILVDDPGHEHDLPQLIESVLERVDMQVPDHLRRWLQKDFFKEHLKQYSKSRRTAPIYWPLSTASGDYTLWIYYFDLDDQTLYTVVNDFLEPKMKSVGEVSNALRTKPSRTASEEQELEKQQDLLQELIELSGMILEIAPNYKPNHDDGVQITAAPLWSLFSPQTMAESLERNLGATANG